MKIGITERGDASLDFSWYDKIHSVDGAIIITKNLNYDTRCKIISAFQSVPIIVHATCTGWGSTEVEPNVPDYATQLNNIVNLINEGFPKDHIVLRIDPIIYEYHKFNGLSMVDKVLMGARNLGILPDMRVRISVLDNYRHINQRLNKLGHGNELFYYGCKYAPSYIMQNITDRLSSYHTQYGIIFETCAEPNLTASFITHTGCISDNDLKIMGLPMDDNLYNNPQNRFGCNCLSCKTELLSPRQRCNHQCLYCYWKD